ncbi:MAG: LysR family transcriptional regulator, partial [Pseudomonadota bacterium]|nr:LysR family transcriptional regulator [Pseudomonadota bacterium]
MARIAERQAEQIDIRAHADPPEHCHNGGAPSSIWNTLPELRALRYFIGVGRAGNFASAARKLAISQTSLTRHIQKLEEGLGTDLFVRHGRGVTLTRHGSRLFERLEMVQQLLTPTLEQHPGSEPSPGSVTLAVPAEAGLLLVQTLVEQFRARWPKTTLDIKEGLSTAIEEWVVSRRVDIAVMEDTPSLADVNIRPVLAVRLGLVAAPAFAGAADPRPLRFRDLSKIPLILPSQQCWIRRRVDRAGFQHGLRLDPIIEVDSLLLRKAIVRHGLGCTVLPFIAVHDEIARGALLFREITQPQLVSTYAIASRARP